MSLPISAEKTVAVERGLVEQTKQYLSMIRFSHTIFALPFALLATVWAYVVPLPHVRPTGTAAPDEALTYLTFRLQDFVGILLCMVLARSFAMAINRLLDHRIDGLNPRTAGRHLPSGALSRQGVTWFSIVCGLLFCCSCLLFLPNRLPLFLSVPVLAFLGGYSVTKRFTRLAHFWLGAALMLAPICVWIALRGEYLVHSPQDILPVVWLGGMILLWTAGFDIIYACQDYEFDRAAGLHSIPSRLGIRNALRVAKVCHALMLCLAFSMSWLFPSLGLGWFYGLAMLCVAGLLIWEHASVSEHSLERINLAFFQLNAVISIVFLVVGSIDSIL